MTVSVPALLAISGFAIGVASAVLTAGLI